MNVIDAAYRTGQDYPGGAEALAVRLGWPNLSDELNPRRANAKLGLQQALDMQMLSGDCRILTAMAAELGFFCVPLPPASASPCAQAVADAAREFAELMQSCAAAFADGRITDTERKLLEHDCSSLTAALQSLLRHATAMHQAGKPDAETRQGGAA